MSRRTLLYRGGLILILVLTAALMFLIGRGHTVYFDNKALEYNGQSAKAPYKIEVTVDGDKYARNPAIPLERIYVGLCPADLRFIGKCLDKWVRAVTERADPEMGFYMVARSGINYAPDFIADPVDEQFLSRLTLKRHDNLFASPIAP